MTKKIAPEPVNLIEGRRTQMLWRATPVIALAISVVILGAGLVIARFASGVVTAQEVKAETVQAQILASSVSAALAFNDQGTAEGYVKALGSNPAVVDAAVYDVKGRAFARYSRLANQTAPATQPAADSAAFRNQAIALAPVTKGPVRLGAVYLRFNVDPPARRYSRFALIALLSAMVAIVVAILGIAHFTLNSANQNLTRQSAELAEANQRLLQQIEERERAEAALRQAQKMEAIGQLTGGVAHDFNNLLQIVLASLDVLSRRSESWQLPASIAQELRRYLDTAQAGGDRAAALTRQLLAFARRQPLEPTKVDINRLVGSMSELLRRTLGETISVETVLTGGIWATFADANQLESALINLAVNARDAMPGGGRLTIETANGSLDEDYAAAHQDAAPGQYVVIAVSDTGNGMTPEILANVFEPFFTTKDIGHGTGLGLSQVYGFVTAIYSESGAGTTVRLYLPRHTAEEAHVAEHAPERPLPRGDGNQTVLVVEDEEKVRTISVDMLRELGYDVLEAANSKQALELIEANPSIQVLFTDIGLPDGLNGCELARAARQCRPSLKVLYTSGYARNAIANDGLSDPGMVMLSKPYTYAALAEKIRQVVISVDA